jgi:hypothetical protein
VRAVAALAALALLAGCARGPARPAPSPTGQATSATSATGQPAPDVRLLSLADVPAGFRVERVEALKPRPVTPPFRPPDCVQRPGTTTAPQAVSVLVRGATRVIETVTVHASAEDARAGLDGIGPQRGCPSVTARAPGNPDVVSAAPSLLPDPGIGDEAKAIGAAGFRAVAFVRGTVLVVVTVTNVPVDVDVVVLARHAFVLLEG